MSQIRAPYRMPLLVAVAMITVWSILGVFDARNVPSTGYQTDGSYTVISVDGGSPAETAGLRVEDRVVTVNGVAIENTREILRQGRPAIGSSSVIEVERGGSLLTFDVVNGPPSTRTLLDSYLFVVIGLCFVFFGFSAYSKAPARKTLLLALAGGAIGVNFAGGPYIGSPALSSVMAAIVVLLIYLGLAMLYHFILSMPQPSAALERSGTLRLLYGPAVVAGVLLAVIIGSQMNATSGLNRMLQVAIGLVLAGYFLGSVVAVIVRYRSATDTERMANGLGLMLMGTIIGFAPLIVVIVSGIIAPRLVLPGSNYYILTFALIPITFSMAAVRSVRNGPTIEA